MSQKWFMVLGAMMAAATSQVGVTELVFDDEIDAVEARDEIRTELATEPVVEEDSIGVTIDSLPRATSDLLESVQPKQKKLTDSDRLRRERIQQELSNEDMIQKKLEEARLKEEKKRADRISKRAEALLGSDKDESTDDVDSEEDDDLSSRKRVEKETIIIEQAAPIPAVVQSELPQEDSNVRPVLITLKPRGGYTDVLNIRDVSVTGRYSFGLEAEVGVNDHFAVGVIYDYSRFGVNSPFFGASAWQPFLGSQDAMFLKQHHARAIAKAYVLSREYRVRPFLGGTLGYRRSNLNYDEAIQDYFATQVGFQTAFQNLRINSMLAGLVAGAEVEITKNIGVSLQFEYSQPMFSRVQGNRIYAGGIAPNSFAIADQDKEYVGRQIRNRGLWSIAGGVGFTF